MHRMRRSLAVSTTASSRSPAALPEGTTPYPPVAGPRPFQLLADDLRPRRVACLGVVPFAPAFGATGCLLNARAQTEEARKFSVNVFPLLDQLFDARKFSRRS